MIIIFDLDYTLYNTDKQKRELASAFGVSWKKYQESYQKYFTKKKQNYNVYKHISFLIQEGSIKKDEAAKARNKAKKALSNGNRFLFPSAEGVLRECKKQGHELILLSFGEKAYQREKIRQLKIKKYFSRIIVTDLSKATSLDFLKKDKRKKVIINDKAREARNLKKTLSTKNNEAKVLLIKGHYNHDIKNNFKVIQLDQVKKLLNIEYGISFRVSTSHKLTAKNNGKEIGRATVVLGRNQHKRPFAIIEDVFVEPEFRGEGVGSKLVKDAIELVKKKNCYKIIMYSRYARPNVHRMYRKLGFQDWGKEFRLNL